MAAFNFAKYDYRCNERDRVEMFSFHYLDTLIAGVLFTYALWVGGPSLFTALRFYLIKRRERQHLHKFYGKKPMPPRPENSNVLHLFHGKKAGILNIQWIDYRSEWTYMVDKSKEKEPDYVLDLMQPGALDQFGDASFGKILVSNCICCTQDIALYQAATFLRSLTRLLKPGGKLYIKHSLVFKGGLDPVGLELLNELGFRGLNGLPGIEGNIVAGWLLLIKEARLPPLVKEEKEEMTKAQATPEHRGLWAQTIEPLERYSVPIQSLSLLGDADDSYNL
ncbi:Hypothetical protein POVN_LOCUS578 [uncultured virus]|nr:Hypothetical protein POVN_LOCUS578 [uncultured virus]